MTAEIVLASTSPYRRALLDGLGVEYTAAAPRFEEDHSLAISPCDIALAFARGKARSLAADYPQAVIIGSDQTVELDGKLLVKPGTTERAVEQLVALGGNLHRLHTAVAIFDARKEATYEGIVTHDMRMRPLTRELARAYVARDETTDCVGAYKIEGLGSLLFESMDGADHTAIVGLPLTLTGALLRNCGVDLLERLLGKPILH